MSVFEIPYFLPYEYVAGMSERGIYAVAPDRPDGEVVGVVPSAICVRCQHRLASSASYGQGIVFQGHVLHEQECYPQAVDAYLATKRLKAFHEKEIS